MHKSWILLFFLAFLSCTGPKRAFVAKEDLTPDYSMESSWAALPHVQDEADQAPEPYTDMQDNAKVDVFFVHPTTFTAKRRKYDWNAQIHDEKINKKTDETSIKFQASVFNGAAKIYAPRYRQAHLNVYYTNDSVSAQQALEIAYSDVLRAFEYYIQHYNNDRPFIIAGHSQGTQHTGRLLKEKIDGKELKSRLVAAYLIGMPVERDYFQSIPLCQSADQTGCFNSWRSFREGHYPDLLKKEKDIAVNNPISWTTDKNKIDRSENSGAVLRNFKVRKDVVGAQINNGVLWMNHPCFPFSFLLLTKNYHIGDYNLFYVDIRNNAILRTKSYLRKISQGGD